MQNPQRDGGNSLISLGFSPGTAFATHAPMEAVKKFAVEGVMGVLGNPFMPYIALLFALLRNL